MVEITVGIFLIYKGGRILNLPLNHLFLCGQISILILHKFINQNVMSINFSKPQDIHIIYYLYAVTHVGKGITHFLYTNIVEFPTYNLTLYFYVDKIILI